LVVGRGGLYLRNKSFLLLFFKKEVLFSFGLYDYYGGFVVC
jgi:hypothetical protein